MVCYIKDTNLSEQEKNNLQSQHEYYYDSLVGREGFEIKKNIEGDNIIIPNNEGLNYLVDSNKELGNVYGITDALTTEPLKAVTINVLNLENKQYTSSVYDYLDEIEESSLPQYRKLAKIFKKSNYDVEIRQVTSQDKIGEIDYFGKVTPTEILIDEQAIREHAYKNGLDETQEVHRIILHELIHTNSVQSIKNSPKLQKQLTKLMNLVEEKSWNLGYEKANPFFDIYEFVAEVFTDTKLQQVMKQIPYNQENEVSSSIWDKFVQVVLDSLKRFGFVEYSTLDEMLNLSSDIFNTKSELSYGDKNNTNQPLFDKFTYQNNNNQYTTTKIQPEITENQSIENVSELLQSTIKSKNINETNSLYQAENNKTIPRSNQEIINNLKEQLREVYPEFKLESLDKLTANNTDINGLVDFGQNIIYIQQGKETALSEEMAHIAIELHPKKQQFLDIVTETKLYGQVYEEYSQYPNYWKNGKIDVEKIKSEAAGKLLGEAIYGQTTGDWSKFDEWITKKRKKDFISKLRKLLNDLIQFIKGSNFNMFKEAAQQLMEGNIPRVAKTDFNEIMYQLDTSLEKSTFNTFQQMFDEVEYLDPSDPNYEDSKGQVILDQLTKAGNILKDNLKLAKDDFGSKAVVPFSNIKDAINAIQRTDNHLENLEQATKRFIYSMDSIKKFARFSQSKIPTSTIETLIKIARFSSQWKFYLKNFEEQANLTEGELYEYLQDVNQVLVELDKKLYDVFKNKTLQIYEEQIKIVTEPIKQAKVQTLLEKFPQWQSHNYENLFLWLRKNKLGSKDKSGSDAWNKVVQTNKPKNSIERTIISIGKLENRLLLKLLDDIVNNTFDADIITDIIKSNDIEGFGSLFIGAATSSDPITAIFQTIIDNAKIKAEEITRDIVENTMNKITPLVAKTNLTTIQIGKQITTEDTRIVNGEEVKTYSYLNDVKEEAYIEKDKKWKEVQELKKKATDTESKKVWLDALEEYQKYLFENWYQDNKPSYYLKLQVKDEELKEKYSFALRTEADRRVDNIWTQIHSIEESMRDLDIMVNGQYNPKLLDLENKLEEKYIEYKRLCSPFDINGEKKNTDNEIDDYKIHKYLSDKKNIADLYKYDPKQGAFELSFNKWVNEYLEKAFQSEFNDPKIQKIISLVNDERKIETKLKEISLLVNDLEVNIPGTEMYKWWKKNVQRIYTQDFYSEREKITSKISEISDEINAIKGVKKKTQEEWQRIFGILKVYRDIDNVIDGTLLSEEEATIIKDFEQELEELKNQEFDISEDLQVRYDVLKKELKDQITLLQQIQNREINVYYNEKLRNLGLNLTGEEFLLYLNEQSFDTIESVEQYFTDTLSNGVQEAIDWFKNNHIQRVKWDGTGFTNVWVQTLQWSETKPTNQDHVSYRLAARYNEKKVEQFYLEDEANKDAFGRWKPRRFKVNEKGEDTKILTNLHNEEYYKLKESRNEQDKAIFEILERLKKFHVDSQYSDEQFLNNYKLYYYIPQVHRKLFEDPSKLLQNFKRNIDGQKQEDGGSNFQPDFTDETIGESASQLNGSGLIGGFLGRITNNLGKTGEVYIPTDYQGERYIRPALELYNHVPIESISQDVLLSQMMFVESSKTHQAFNELNPKITIMYKALKNIGADQKRIKNVENIIDREVQGINKLYESGVALDKFLSFLKQIGNIRSQSLVNIKGAIKNKLAGTGNLWVNKSLLSDYNIAKAEKEFMTDWYELKTQMLSNVPKTEKFKLMEYFIPRIGQTYKWYTADKLRQTFKNNSWFFSLQEEGEFTLFGTSLNLFLESNYKNGKLKDALKVIKQVDKEGNENLRLILGEDTEKDREELRRLKRKFMEMMRIIQGNQGMQKAKTETSRYTLWSAVMHYRNYLPYVIINRFAKKRTNYTAEIIWEGYYRTFIREAFATIKDLKNAKENWANLTDYEKENIFKCVKELAIMGAAWALLMLLGYDDGDKNRFKKLKQNNYFHNLLIYETLASYQEIIGLSIFRLTGFFKEASTNITRTSMAFGEIGKLIDVVDDLFAFMRQSDSAYVEKNSAFAKKGDIKWVNDLKKLTGLNNLTGTVNNEQLAEQIKNYVTQLERN